MKDAKDSNKKCRRYVALGSLGLLLSILLGGCGTERMPTTLDASDIQRARSTLEKASEPRNHNRPLREQWAMLKRVGERLVRTAQPVCADVARQLCTVELALVYSRQPLNAFTIRTSQDIDLLQDLGLCPDSIMPLELLQYRRAPGSTGWRRFLAILEKVDRDKFYHLKEKDDWCLLAMVSVSPAKETTSPMGIILVPNFLIDLCENDDELSALLGHEFAHAIKKHNIQDEGRLQALKTLFLIADVAFKSPNLSDDFPYLISDLVRRTSGQSDELEADYIGAFLVAHAGYNLGKAAQFWAKLLRHISPPLTSLDTHPAPVERVAIWQKAAAKLRSSRNALPSTLAH